MPQKTNNEFADFEIEELPGEGEYGQNNQSRSAKTVFSDLPKRQKIAVISLALFSIVFLGAWAVNLKNNISKPFIQKDDLANKTTDSANNNTDPSQQADTDKDGLNDYLEKNVYRTSPYLSDSDGDGMEDVKEIESGTDPICPKGRDCSQDGLFSPNAKAEASLATTTDGFSNIPDLPDTQAPPRQMTAEEKEQITASLGDKADTKLLREMLVEAGMEKEMLDKISDEDLVKSYEEILK